MLRRIILGVVLLLLAVSAFAADERSVTQVADGVYLIRHQTEPFEGGNSIVIIGGRDVLVVDSSGRPAATEYDLQQIRRLTPKPVRYLVNTHWHMDHNTGNSLYERRYPGLAIIAHEETKPDMDLYAATRVTRFSRDIGLARQQVESGKDPSGVPLTPERLNAQKARLAALLEADQALRGWSYLGPNLLFRDRLELDLGSRIVHVRYFGRGNTAGDAVVHLPAENILITGDLVVHPVPYTYDGYPSEWIKTLDALLALQPRIIIPGHGPALHDTSYVLLVREFLQSAVNQLNARLKIVGPAEFRTFDEVESAIDLSSFRPRFVGSNPELGPDFDEISDRLRTLVFREAQLR